MPLVSMVLGYQNISDHSERHLAGVSTWEDQVLVPPAGYFNHLGIGAMSSQGICECVSDAEAKDASVVWTSFEQNHSSTRWQNVGSCNHRAHMPLRLSDRPLLPLWRSLLVSHHRAPAGHGRC